MIKVLLIRAAGKGTQGQEIAKLTGWFYASHVDDETDTVQVKDFTGSVFTVSIKDIQMYKQEEVRA